MISRALAAFSFLLLGAALLPGCGAGDGGVCQLSSDCAAGLMCTCKLGGGPEARGICHATEPASCTGSTTDAFVPLVDAAIDAGRDAFVSTDANAADAPLDAGHDAASSTDAGADGGTDAATDAATDTGTSSDAGADTHTDAG